MATMFAPRKRNAALRRWYQAFGCFFVPVVCGFAPVSAQIVSATPPALTAAPAESLLIGPGDVLSIRVLNEPELTQEPRVTDTGDVPLMLIGNVHIAGLTPGAASAIIEQQYMAKQFLLHPRVSITVQQYVTQNISVIGEVHNTGAFPAPTAKTITEVLAQAGGLSELADRHIVIRRRSNGSEIPFYFSNNPNRLLSEQPMVYPGDTVFVPKAGTIYMLGDVTKPGGYVMANEHSQLTALQALAMAGGAKETARPSRARLVRQTEEGAVEQELALDDMRKGKIPDMPLQSDDIIYVPYSYLKNVAVSLPAILASATSSAIYIIR